MKSKWILTMLIGGVTGCRIFQPRVPNRADELMNMGSDVASGGYGVLPMVGGISIIGGILLLFISRAQKGWIPLSAGIALVILNLILCEYLAIIAIPALIMSGCIGVFWTWHIINKHFFQ